MKQDDVIVMMEFLEEIGMKKHLKRMVLLADCDVHAILGNEQGVIDKKSLENRRG